MPYLDTRSESHLWLRDFQTQIEPNETQRNTLIVAGIYVIIIAILWHVPYLEKIIYPFKLLTVGFHEMSHAFAGVLTCATIHSIELNPDEGGVTKMSGGIPSITLPAGYLGSTFIGACLIACGFNTDASKVASIVLAVFFLFTLWWAKRNWLSWILILSMSGLIVFFWFIGGGVALRYLVLFIGVMSCLYCVWDIIDDTVIRKVENSDASAFARICGCCPSRVWGVIWTIQAIIFFAFGIIIGLLAFKENAQQQASDASHFLPVPGSTSSALSLEPSFWVLLSTFTMLLTSMGAL
jgi:hypothetical protein